MRSELLRLAAALPALAGSLWLMRRAGADTSLLTQQIAAAAVSFAGVALTRPSWPRTGAGSLPALALVIGTGLLWAPVWGGTLAGPERWLHVGGVRVYVASVLLPAMVVLLARAFASPFTTSPWPWWLLPAALWALAVQPDASQTTAFALASVLPVWRAAAGVGAKTVVALALVAGVAWAWWQPDPLVPVPYVEGVLDLAGAAGALALAAALAALALPVLMLAQQARMSNDAALLSVVVYYVAIGVLAWRQLTPMPLLGFGAGPVAGYALMVAAIGRRP